MITIIIGSSNSAGVDGEEVEEAERRRKRWRTVVIAHNKYLRSLDYYLAKAWPIACRSLWDDDASPLNSHTFLQSCAYRPKLGSRVLGVTKPPARGGHGTQGAMASRRPRGLVATLLVAFFGGCWISQSFVAGRPPAPRARSVARCAEEEATGVALEDPPSDAEISEETSLDPRPLRKIKPKRYARRELNEEAERLRPYIEPLLYDKHLSLKEITFVLNRKGKELRHLLYKPRVGLPVFTEHKVRRLMRRAKNSEGVRINRFVRPQHLPPNAPGAPYAKPMKEVYAEVPPLGWQNMPEYAHLKTGGESAAAPAASEEAPEEIVEETRERVGVNALDGVDPFAKQKLLLDAKNVAFVQDSASTSPLPNTDRDRIVKESVKKGHVEVRRQLFQRSQKTYKVTTDSLLEFVKALLEPWLAAAEGEVERRCLKPLQKAQDELRQAMEEGRLHNRQREKGARRRKESSKIDFSFGPKLAEVLKNISTFRSMDAAAAEEAERCEQVCQEIRSTLQEIEKKN
eukprot:s1562_g5.t1